jgi:hypothetical protein
MATAEYTEDCCFNYPRDHCKGDACPCKCHAGWPKDAGPQPDEMVRLQQALDATEAEVDRLNRLVDTLSRALARYQDHETQPF